MRIALLHYSCPPVVGGVEEIVRQQAALFTRYGHQVRVLAGAGDVFETGIDVRIDPLLSSRNTDILARQQPGACDAEKIREYSRNILRFLEESLTGYDLLIAHNVLTMPYNLPLTRALHRWADAGNRLISWNHDSPYFYENRGPHLDNEPWDILRENNPNIRYVAISESRLQEFGKLYGTFENIEMIPNGIDPIRFFRLDELSVRLILENDLFRSELLLVQPSRLHPRKNIETSIRVIRALQDKNVQARLLLTGAYDPHEEQTMIYYRKLTALARDLEIEKDIIVVAEARFRDGSRVTADRIKMRDLYLISDVLFLPSKQEGFGIPLLEAGMIKLPVVCSDIPPFRSIAFDQVCYFKPDDSADMIVEKLLEFLKRLPTFHMHRNVMRNYVWDNIYHRQILPLINKLQQDHS